MNITKNFTYEELVRSSTAQAHKIDNVPPTVELGKLQRLCKEVLQPIRDKYGKPIWVSSGYRCPKVNTLVGGSKTSQHMKGEAADIKATKTSNADLFNLIKSMIEKKEIIVGQLIWEYGTKKEPQWVHVSLPREKNNNQILYIGVK